VQDDDLFEVIPPALDADPWDDPPTLKLRTGLLDQLRAGSVSGRDDLSSALALTRLVRAEPEAFGTGGGEKLGDAEIALAQRTLRAVLQRLGIDLTLPWRDFAGFRSYWLKNNCPFRDGFKTFGCRSRMVKPQRICGRFGDRLRRLREREGTGGGGTRRRVIRGLRGPDSAATALGEVRRYRRARWRLALREEW
jgi:hypothetical protein